MMLLLRKQNYAKLLTFRYFKAIIFFEFVLFNNIESLIGWFCLEKIKKGNSLGFVLCVLSQTDTLQLGCAFRLITLQPK